MGPTFSIVTPVYNTPIDLLREMIASVRHQTYADWELILVDDCSPDEAVREVLREVAREDPRIVVIERAENGHIVKASNDGVAAARGQFVVLLDHDDLLTPDALEENRRAIEREPEADVLYSDEDRLMADGTYQFRFRKPDWSPWRLRTQNYLGHLTVIRTDLVREIGGFREGFDGSQDHDLVLRATERARRVVHVPHVLYHWRVIPGSVADRMDAKPYATYAAMKAIREHLERIGVDAEVSVVRPGLYAVSAKLGEPTVSLVAVVDDPGSEAALAAAKSVAWALHHSHHATVEVGVVHPEGMDLRAFERPFEERQLKLPVATRYLPHSPQSSGIAQVKEAATSAVGDYVVVLGGDTRPVHVGWLRALLTPLACDDVAVTSGLVVTDKRGVANAGLAAKNGRWRYPLRGFDARHEGPFGVLHLAREVDAVDGSCVAFRRADAAELLSDAAGATDLGLVLSAAAARQGRSVVWNGQSRYHSADYRPTDLSRPRSGAGDGPFLIVESADNWILAGDRLVRAHAPALMPSWRRFKRARRKVRKRLRSLKRRLGNE